MLRPLVPLLMACLLIPAASAGPHVQVGVGIEGYDCIGDCEGGVTLPLVEDQGYGDLVVAVVVTNDMAYCFEAGTSGVAGTTCEIVFCDGERALLASTLAPCDLPEPPMLRALA